MTCRIAVCVATTLLLVGVTSCRRAPVAQTAPASTSQPTTAPATAPTTALIANTCRIKADTAFLRRGAGDEGIYDVITAGTAVERGRSNEGPGREGAVVHTSEAVVG